ncbi:hypothetical protein D3C75_1183940 [compost metagenome]
MHDALIARNHVTQHFFHYINIGVIGHSDHNIHEAVGFTGIVDDIASDDFSIGHHNDFVI